MEGNVADVILGSAVIITSTTIVRQVTDKTNKSGNPLKTLFFGFLLSIGLLGSAVVAPNFAKGLAYLGIVGAFAVNGPAVFAWVKGL